MNNSVIVKKKKQYRYDKKYLKEVEKEDRRHLKKSLNYIWTYYCESV